MWVKMVGGNAYKNTDTATSAGAIEVADTPPYWLAALDSDPIDTGATYATQAEAVAVAQKIVFGIDLSTLL